jgi:endogenous inhibitor of DNA gyrase (YacG/DUF329 family)
MGCHKWDVKSKKVKALGRYTYPELTERVCPSCMKTFMPHRAASTLAPVRYCSRNCLKIGRWASHQRWSKRVGADPMSPAEAMLNRNQSRVGMGHASIKRNEK